MATKRSKNRMTEQTNNGQWKTKLYRKRQRRQCEMTEITTFCNVSFVAHNVIHIFARLCPCATCVHVLV